MAKDSGVGKQSILPKKTKLRVINVDYTKALWTNNLDWQIPSTERN